MSGTVADVLEVARSQIGVTSGRRYFEDMGDEWWGQAWCARFGRWVYWKAGVDCHWPYDVTFDERDVPAQWRRDKYDAKPGMAVSFDWDDDGKGDHFGIVESRQDWGLATIEGNTGTGVVARRQRVWASIICCIEPTYADAEGQRPGDAVNDAGLHYRAYADSLGWLPAVRDGQTAGTTGRSLRVEAVKLTPPEGVTLDVFAHVQGVGTLGYPGVRRGASSGTGSSDNDPIIGTVGQGRRLEAVMLRCVENDTGMALHVQAHVQGVGWQEPVGAGEWAGTRGQSRRLEALRIWLA